MSSLKDEYPKIFTGLRLTLRPDGGILRNKKPTYRLKPGEFATAEGEVLDLGPEGVLIENKKAGFIRVIKKVDRVDL